MNIVPVYMPRALPKTYKTTEMQCRMVQEYKKDDEGEFERDENGKKIKKGPATMVMEEVESTGGILFTMPRGHSVRLTDPAQLKQFNVTSNPKLVDLETGEEVDEHGTPLYLKNIRENGYTRTREAPSYNMELKVEE